MKKLSILLGCICLAFSSLANAGGDGRESAVWWLKNYGGVTAREEAVVAHAERVFEKVMAAADKNGKRFPRLVVLNYREPYTASIQDGSILLTLGGLKLCYQGVTPKKGEARLAFILGHELAHQAKDDYWHSTALESVKEFKGSKSGIRAALLASLRKGAGRNPERAREAVWERELQADSYGLLYMAMAGYDPQLIVEQAGTSFFREWTTRISGGSSFDGPGYPTPEERAEFFRVQLASIADEVALFTSGVRLLQIGKYQDALLLLDRFREKFPSREVFANIGLAHFQLSMKELAGCDPSALFRFKLPAIVDVKTLAPRGTTRSGNNACRDNDSYLRSLTTAIRHLEMAASKDQQHFPTQVNLASAYIFAGEYARAMAAADTALKLSPDNSLAINCKAVALSLFGRLGGLDTTDAALTMLREATARNPEIADSLYNQAALAAERDREAAAKEAWKAFLAKEPSGLYAKAAMRRLGFVDETAPPVSVSNNPKPPIKLGEINGETALFLKNIGRRSFSIGRTAIDIYEGNGVRALAINGNIEVIETDLEKPRDLVEFKREHGEPLRVVANTVGSTLVYQNFAVDSQGGGVMRMVFFEGNGERENKL